MYFIIGILMIGLILLAFKNQQVDFEKDTPDGIQFYKGTWKEALTIAKKENKLIFLDIYATWCGPCKKLKSNTFSDAKVGSFYNNNFINLAMDGERGEGLVLAQKYLLKSYPTLLFIDEKGNVVTRTVGYHDSEEFIELGKTIKKQ